MKVFEDPVIEVLNLDIQDIVTASGDEPEETIPALIPPCVN